MEKYIFKMEFTKENFHETNDFVIGSPNFNPYIEIISDNVKVRLPQSELEGHVVSANPANATLAETCSLMTSSDYKDRFLAEYIQLKNRINGLYKMLDNWDKGKLSFTPTCPRETYDLQVRAMKDYLFILVIRAKMEGITLPE